MAVYRLFIVACALLPPILGQCSLENAAVHLKRPIYDFTMDLATRLAQEKENHFVSSTLSSWIIISMLSLGATDYTRNDIQRVLKLHPHSCFNKKYWDILKTVLDTKDRRVILAQSSVIIMDENIQVTDLFSNFIRNSGLCEIVLTNFEDSFEAAAEVNNYFRITTSDYINDLVIPEDFYDKDIVLVADAAVHKAVWTHSFGPEEVNKFYNELGNELGDIKLMLTRFNANITVIDQIQAEVIQLPYGEREEYSMLIFLPFKDVQLSTVIHNLKSLSLATVFKKFEKEYEDEKDSRNVRIPKFNMTSDLDNLKELLSDMGLKGIFDATAKFFDISEDPLYLSNFLQKASIDVNSQGVTTLFEPEGGFRYSDNDFVVNRPFFYMTVNNEYQIPIFVGAYSKPSIV